MCVGLLLQLDGGFERVNLFSRVTSVPGTGPGPQAQTSAPVVTTAPPSTRAKADVKVLVANGAGVKGLASAATNALRNVGYTVLAPVDATATVAKTAVRFSAGYEAEAREVAAALTFGPAVVSALTVAPVAAGDIGDAQVIVILGADLDTAAPNAPPTTRP